MRFAALSVDENQERLHTSVNSLAVRHPELSAATLLAPWQRNALIALMTMALLGALASSVATGLVFMTLATALYASAIINRIVLFGRSMRPGQVEVVSDAEARSIPDEDLPVYTILVPAYREPEVIVALLNHLDELEYPRDRLDVKILLEADDAPTIDAVVAASEDVGDHVSVVLVPVLEPRTKPKALNFGLSLARGDFVTIYDAEDHPEPLQLRRAVVALRRLGDDVACLQAKLFYDNIYQNLITRWFSLEYYMWFSLLLPGLVATGAPLPLGGTSNHFRRRALEAVGAWDPYNVTEDADLGVRLHRNHYSVRILDSVTLEEANSDFVNWVKQRSRWYKGYLQTLLIHLRQPRRLRQDIGRVGVLQFVLFVGATPFLAFINPVFWTMTIVWFVGHPHFVKAIFPAPVFYISFACWTVGNFAVTYLTIVTARLERRWDLLGAALLVPLYWVMMSVAAAKAVLQLVFIPSFWEKTVHGLRRETYPAPSESASIL